MTRPAVTVALLCARPDGLVAPLQCLAKQDFAEPWELLVVNWGFGEQDELLKTLWAMLRPDIPLRHVGLLPPLPIHDGSYGAWDMGTTFNTAWAHAQGEHVVFIEDFWVFRPNWIAEHIQVARSGDNFCLGRNHALPVFDDNAPLHYGVDAVIMVNFSHRTELAWRGIGAPEYPTRHPECTILPLVFGIDHISRVPAAHAWHTTHYPGGGFGQVMQKAPYDNPLVAYMNPDGSAFNGHFKYYPVRPTGVSEAYSHPRMENALPYQRNLREERLRLGHWV